jgi:hypothetical protein
MGGACGTHWVGEMRVQILLEILNGTDHSEDLGIHGRTVLKCILRDSGWRMWIGFIWHTTETTDGILWSRYWTSGFHKRRGIFLISESTISFLRRILLVSSVNWYMWLVKECPRLKVVCLKTLYRNSLMLVSFSSVSTYKHAMVVI